MLSADFAGRRNHATLPAGPRRRLLCPHPGSLPAFAAGTAIFPDDVPVAERVHGDGRVELVASGIQIHNHFGEDLAALCGLVLAFVAVGLTMWTGNPMFDAAGTLAIGVLLVLVAVFVAIEVKALLIGQSADAELRSDLGAFLQSRPEIVRVFNLITLQLGPDVMVAAKAQMRGDGGDVVDAINAVERDMRARYPQIRWSFFEPDRAD